MDCPNCNKEMKDKSYMYYSIGDWDMDYPSSYHEEYWCSNCRIKYVNGEWIIPKKYERATDKQIKCANFICRELGLSFDPLLKTKTWEFINAHIKEAKDNKNGRNNSYEYYDDYYDWYSEEF